jgi:hypothetical protein
MHSHQEALDGLFMSMAVRENEGLYSRAAALSLDGSECGALQINGDNFRALWYSGCLLVTLVLN